MLTFYPGSGAIGFIKELMDADRFVAQVTPYNDNPVTAIFDLTGLNQAVQPLQETCGWSAEALAAAEADRDATDAALEAEAEAKYSQIDVTLGEEFRATAGTLASTVRLYPRPGDYDDYIEDVAVGKDVTVEVLRRFRVRTGDRWRSFWYYIELPNGVRAWTNPGLISRR